MQENNTTETTTVHQIDEDLLEAPHLPVLGKIGISDGFDSLTVKEGTVSYNWNKKPKRENDWPILGIIQWMQGILVSGHHFSAVIIILPNLRGPDSSWIPRSQYQPNLETSEISYARPIGRSVPRCKHPT